MTVSMLHSLVVVVKELKLNSCIVLSLTSKQSGAVEACWAHNPEVRGSKPRSARNGPFLKQICFYVLILYFLKMMQVQERLD